MVENKNYKTKQMHFSYKSYFSEIDLIKRQSSKCVCVAVFITVMMNFLSRISQRCEIYVYNTKNEKTAMGIVE